MMPSARKRCQKGSLLDDSAAIHSRISALERSVESVLSFNGFSSQATATKSAPRGVISEPFPSTRSGSGTASPAPSTLNRFEVTEI